MLFSTIMAITVATSLNFATPNTTPTMPTLTEHCQVYSNDDYTWIITEDGNCYHEDPDFIGYIHDKMYDVTFVTFGTETRVDDIPIVLSPCDYRPSIHDSLWGWILHDPCTHISNGEIEWVR